MAYVIKEETLVNIGNAIRAKTKRSESMLVGNFPAEIANIPTTLPALTNPTAVTPEDSNYNGAMLAVITAMSYYFAKTSETAVFEYVDGCGVLKSTNSDGTGKLTDSNGHNVMDCSTYTGLVLRGLDYNTSPYAEASGANKTYVVSDVKCSSDFWSETYLDKQTNADALTRVSDYDKTTDGHYRVITASDIGAYYAKMGLTWFPGEREVKPGDLCFFYKAEDDGTLKYPDRFLGLSHVGIMVTPDTYLNITEYDSSGDLILTTVSARAPYMYARPLYGALSKGKAEDLTPNEVDLIPDIWSNIPQGVSTINGVTLTLNGKRLTMSGTSSSFFGRGVIWGACCLYLTPGTYKLSGVVNNTGANTVNATHSLFGMRVYDADTDEGITGTTTSSNGANTAERTPVWDIGGGAVFNISKPTRIKIDAYFGGSRDLSNISVTPVLMRVS